MSIIFTYFPKKSSACIMLAEIAQIFHLLINKPIFLAQDRCYTQIRATNSFFCRLSVTFMVLYTGLFLQALTHAHNIVALLPKVASVCWFCLSVFSFQTRPRNYVVLRFLDVNRKKISQKIWLEVLQFMRALNDSRKKSIHVQYSQLDSSGQNLDSKGD